MTKIAAVPEASPLAPQRDVLDWALAPTPAAQFFDDIFERRVFHHARNQPDYWHRLLTLGELDQILGTHEVRFPDIRLAQSGATIETEDYSVEGLIDPLAVARLYSRGATVIFSHLQNRSKPIADFVNGLSSRFSSPVQANVYLTPAQAQGFPAHWDTHCVLVLQISGSKVWKIYDGGPALPLRGQHFEKGVHSAAVGPVTEEFELKAGDVAYVPRGVIHSAHSTDQASLHITVGLLNYTWVDVILEAVADVALSDERFRKSVRVDDAMWASAEWRDLVAQRWRELSAAVNLPASVAALRSDMLSRQKPYLGNLLSQTGGALALHADSVIALRSGAQYDLLVEAERVQVEFMGHVIDFPGTVTAALQKILDRQPVRISQLPGRLAIDERLVLARRLIHEGLVEVLD